MNSDIDHDTNCVFYDSELKALEKAFDTCNEVFKRIRKRAERRQTVQISRSLFDFVEKRKSLDISPQVFYDFIYGDIRLCIYRFRRDYGILAVGYDWKGHSIHPTFSGAGTLYDCVFSSYYEAIPSFVKVVFDFLMDDYRKHIDDVLF